MTDPYDVGDVVTVWVVFRDEAGEQSIPSEFDLAIRPPDGVEYEASPSTITLDHLARASAATDQDLTDVTGIYMADIPITAAGLWRYRWNASGDLVTAQEGSFQVRRQRVGASGS